MIMVMLNKSTINGQQQPILQQSGPKSYDIAQLFILLHNTVTAFAHHRRQPIVPS
jgi:hypothetical protein